MKKPNKSKALDTLAAKLRSALARETTNIIEIGDILIESRKLLANAHGQWMPWLAEHFDMSYRSAINYCKAAEYVARKGKSATVANLANIAPSVLYNLAAGHYGAEEEAAILVATSEGRVDQTRAYAICYALKHKDDPEDLEELPAPDVTREIFEATEDAEAAEDPEIAAILDGPPPLPPPEPSSSPDVMLAAFDRAITTLMQVMTKPAVQFAGTVHAVNDLEHVEGFLSALRQRLLQRRADGVLRLQ